MPKWNECAETEGCDRPIIINNKEGAECRKEVKDRRNRDKAEDGDDRRASPPALVRKNVTLAAIANNINHSSRRREESEANRDRSKIEGVSA